MGTLVCVDPGKHAIAVSVWRERSLVDARLITGSRLVFSLEVLRYDPDQLVVECPMVYPYGTKGAGEDPNDLIEVALSAGACLGSCEKVVCVYPRQWKGTVPKDLHNRRVESQAPANAKTFLESVQASLRHNVWDAIGLGLWALSVEGRSFCSSKGVEL